MIKADRLEKMMINQKNCRFFVTFFRWGETGVMLFYPLLTKIVYHKIVWNALFLAKKEKTPDRDELYKGLFRGNYLYNTLSFVGSQ